MSWSDADPALPPESAGAWPGPAAGAGLPRRTALDGTGGFSLTRGMRKVLIARGRLRASAMLTSINEWTTMPATVVGAGVRGLPSVGNASASGGPSLIISARSPAVFFAAT